MCRSLPCNASPILRLPRLSSPCQRLELHYCTNRSPKAANELGRIRWARRLESTTRLSLVNLGIICRQFGTIRHHHRRPFSARYKKIEKFHSPPLSTYPNFGVAQKSLYLSSPVCTYLSTYVYIYLPSSRLLSSKESAACLPLYNLGNEIT